MLKGFGPPVVSAAEVSEAKILRKSVMQHFQHLEDPRVERTKRHSLSVIITIAIFAVLAGADGFVAMETYGLALQAWLEKFLDLPNGIPTHDTFARVLGTLEPQALQASFLSWVSSISQKLGLDVIHIDGNRRWVPMTGKRNSKPCIASVPGAVPGVVLAQHKVEDKSNEITAVPLLLKLLNLKGSSSDKTSRTLLECKSQVG